MKLVFKEGESVVIKMDDHIWLDEVGTVDMVLKNQGDIPDAVLIKTSYGSDWFFGIKENLQQLL